MKKIAQKLRSEIFKALIKEIEEGKFYRQDIDRDKLYELHNSVRHEYLSPKERGGNNSGYMNVWEMDASMEDAF